jgi:hypothetical protein
VKKIILILFSLNVTAAAPTADVKVQPQHLWDPTAVTVTTINQSQTLYDEAIAAIKKPQAPHKLVYHHLPFNKLLVGHRKDLISTLFTQLSPTHFTEHQITKIEDLLRQYKIETNFFITAEWCKALPTLDLDISETTYSGLFVVIATYEKRKPAPTAAS